MATKKEQLAAIITTAISSMTQGRMTTGAALEKARKESPDADSVTAGEVDEALRQWTKGQDVGTAFGSMDVPHLK
ncbi:hypothetical protein [Streptomyces sp. NPDC048638]|uniref:hypothetical protein n=1 Tax=Streptomyces sp. NPDC048638 TaxID=3365580 RepID=UPI003714B7AA